MSRIMTDRAVKTICYFDITAPGRMDFRASDPAGLAVHPANPALIAFKPEGVR
jgi:hypothetical protein